MCKNIFLKNVFSGNSRPCDLSCTSNNSIKDFYFAKNGCLQKYSYGWTSLAPTGNSPFSSLQNSNTNNRSTLCDMFDNRKVQTFLN